VGSYCSYEQLGKGIQVERFSVVEEESLVKDVEDEAAEVRLFLEERV